MRIKRAWSHRSDLNVAGETVTVITRRYIAVLKRFLRALNSKCAGTFNQQSFQEDGPATRTRTSLDNLAWLQDRFVRINGPKIQFGLPSTAGLRLEFLLVTQCGVTELKYPSYSISL